MVGLFDQFLFIRDKLIASKTVSYHDRVIWVSGMAGIGKTRLAKKLLQDPSVKAHFECVAFVRVGPQFRREEVLDAITTQLNLQAQKMIVEWSFVQCFWRIVRLRKSLIVLDDVWNNMDVLIDGMLFGEETQILVTSRVNNLGFLNLKMRFMDEEESWELLRRNVFGEEECPPQLVRPGKKIAKNCEGLPLLINAVAPILLSEAQKDPECWNRVAEKPHSVLEKASHQISEVLLSSYHPLTEYQKLCFLYLAAFPLKSFHSLIINPTLLRPPPPLAILPSRLAKLTLSGFGYPWEHMRKILRLGYLKELKLQHYAFGGEKWDAKVIRFSQLRSFTIEDTDLVEWTAKDESFIYLEYLTFKNCYKLREIPFFRNVRAIKLVDCNPLAEACAKQKHPGAHWDSRTKIVAANYSWK